MALKTTFLASLCGTLLLADIGWSGECDCRPEIGNASAIVSDQCGKIWSSDRCTLKETRPELALASQAGAPITSILSASIQDLLRGAQVDPDYVDSVMEIISDNSNAIENVWASSDSIVLQGDAATAAVGDFCFVAISEVSEENLYISAHPQESSCSAWARLR